MKPLTIFISMGPNYDPVLKAVQEACALQCVQELITLGDWDFIIETNKSTKWYCVKIQAEFPVWKLLHEHRTSHLDELRDWLDNRLDDERMRR